MDIAKIKDILASLLFTKRCRFCESVIDIREEICEKCKNEIFKIIHKTNTPEFNFNAPVQGIGFTRSFSECFEIDSKGNFAEAVLINEYILKYMDESLEEKLTDENQFFTYTKGTLRNGEAITMDTPMPTITHGLGFCYASCV